MNIYYSLFVAFVWFLSTYFNVILLLTLINNRKSIFESPVSLRKDLPIVSIIVPAYNEEKTIVDSLQSLGKLDYPKDKLEIIIINDGSKDKTAELIYKHKLSHMKFIDNHKNKGKAGCLNQGIAAAKGEFVACMDADSELSPDIILKTIPYFEEEKVGAVSVAVEVKNPKNFLEKLVEIEYIIGLSLALKALSWFNAMHVTPGPFSIYRKSLLDSIGHFDADNITEDMEIAYRIHKAGYKIAFCATTKVLTVIPNTFQGLYKQRKRWYTGSLETLKQHKDVIFNRQYGHFAMIMPYSFILITLGLNLFAFTLYLTTTNAYKTITFFSLTHFNFISYLKPQEFDVMVFGGLTFLGIFAIMTTFVSAFICLRIAQKSIRQRMLGFIAMPLLFFMYQYFWAVSFYNFFRRRKVSWR